MDAAAAPLRDAATTCVVAAPITSDTRDAARALLAVAVVGATVSALTWHLADAGLGWLVADCVLVAAVVAGIGRGRPGLAAWAMGMASMWLAGVTCWRASDWALATALPGSLVTLATAALFAARRTSAIDVADVGRASLDALRSIPGGIADGARLPPQALGQAARGHAVGVLRGLLLGAPIALFFTALLAADGSFRNALTRIVARSGDGMDLTFWTGTTLCVLLVAWGVLGRVGVKAARPSTAEATVVPVPYRTEGDAQFLLGLGRRARATGPRVRPLTWGVVLAQTLAVFGVYVAANAGTLFEGHAHLRARGTGTYAGYLHEGFAQVSVAALLAVACVVAGHVLLRPREGGRIAGGRSLVAIELGLLALVGVTLASCAHRLAIYEQAYGYTYLRLGVWLLQLGVAGLLAMTAARCLARAWRGWASALTWSALAFGVLAASTDADGWIARRNVARSGGGVPLDVDYLASLSEDARIVLPQVHDRDAARVLSESWSDQAAAHRGHGWRALRGLGDR
jgi:hypothetical protein